MSTDHSVTAWLRLLEAGNADAAQRLWERYFARLVASARQRLRSLPRRVADEEDVALSAFHSFCQGLARGRFPRLSDRHDLWQLLLLITARKAISQYRRQRRLKRGGTRFVPAALDVEELIGQDPDPQFAAQVAEEFRRLLECLDDEDLRRLALRKLEGYTNQEIAHDLDCSPRSVERKLALIRARWHEAGPPPAS